MIGAGEFFAKQVQEARHESSLREDLNKEQELLASMPELESTDEEEIEELDKLNLSDVEFFYIWDIFETVFELYKIVRLYPAASDSLDPALINLLCIKRELDFEDTLVQLALIHSGFMSEIMKTTVTVKEN